VSIAWRNQDQPDLGTEVPQAKSHVVLQERSATVIVAQVLLATLGSVDTVQKELSAMADEVQKELQPSQLWGISQKHSRGTLQTRNRYCRERCRTLSPPTFLR
jgi:hypothetical protein